MIEIIVTYRAQCDWPSACRNATTIHSAESLAAARERARRDGWTFSHARDGSYIARCPAHAFAKFKGVA